MPRSLQVDLRPFDLESGVLVTCDMGYLSVPILVSLGLSVVDLGPTYATDRQTSSDIVDAHRRLMPLPYGRGITMVQGHSPVLYHMKR